MKIPEKVISRLSLYHFILEDMKDEDSISSTKIAELLNIDDSQVRKDFKYIKNSGKCGVGYNVKQLKLEIEEKLGFKQKRNVILLKKKKVKKNIVKIINLKIMTIKLKLEI